MLDAEKLILEVQLQPCLWNSANKSNSDRFTRKLAWEQIANNLHSDWSSFTEEKQNEIIDDLQKKWKHYRDYYIREKKKHFLSGNARRMRNTPYFKILKFLDVTINSRYIDPSNFQQNIENSTISSLNNSSPATSSKELSSERNAKKRERQPSFSNIDMDKMADIERPNDEHDKNFLLSLLPDMRSMTEREKFEFKFEIMSAIKRIKYSNPIQVFSELSPSSSRQFHQECKIEYRPPSSASNSDNASKE